MSKLAIAAILAALLIVAIVLLVKPAAKKAIGFKPPLTDAEKIRVLTVVGQRLSGVDSADSPTLEEMIDGVLDAMNMNDDPHERTLSLLADFAQVMDLGWGSEGVGRDLVTAVEQRALTMSNSALRQAVADLIAHLGQRGK